MHTKSLDVLIEKAESSAYDARFVMSASSPDRVKDTIDPAAYTPSLGKKLIALWQHDKDQPMGYWENLRVEAGKLIGDLKVAGTQLGLMVKQLVADGVPLGASIGFRGAGEDNKKGGIHFKTIELLECSVVSVPAHPLAMQIAKQFGIDIAQPLHLNQQQKVALARAKNILAENTREPKDTALQAFDKVAADARAYLVANESQIDPRVDIDITFTSGGYEVCFERK